MRLKNNNALIAFLFAVGCSTSPFRIDKSVGDKHELTVASNRVALECEALENGRFGFMIHILDEEKTYLTAIQSNQLSKSDCSVRAEKIGKILRQGRHIYFAGIGDLKEPREREKSRHTRRARLGAFPGNKRVLTFIAIANEKGQCYDAYSGESKPCPNPEHGFPLK